jgi:hypothetical protein
MEDKYTKYFQLSLRLFFAFLGFIIAAILILLGLKFLFGMLDKIPWFVFMYMLCIIIVPATLFISIFIVYFKRTARHPSVVVRGISYSIFAIALLSWAACFVLDIIVFFKKGSRDIGNYYSYNIFLLAASVVIIFLVGVLQALSTKKEKDWLEKREERESHHEG